MVRYKAAKMSENWKILLINRRALLVFSFSYCGKVFENLVK